MVLNNSNNNLNTPLSYTAICTDRTGRALIVQRMKQVMNPAEDWEELVELID